MRIGDLAEASGVSAQTIRFYEREGLLPPPHREENGYRRYQDGAAARIHFIRSAQAAGLLLSEISDVLKLRESGQAPCSHVESLLDDKLTAVRARLRELAQMEDQLVALIDSGKDVDPMSCSESGICDIIPVN